MKLCSSIRGKLQFMDYLVRSAVADVETWLERAVSSGRTLAELEVQAVELRRRAEGIARFLSSLTHELRTPLYAVRGMTEAILRDHEDTLSDGMRQDIALIDGAMVEALELVNDHLDIAKLEAGRTIVRLTNVRVPELFATLRAVVVPSGCSQYTCLPAFSAAMVIGACLLL